MSGSTTRWGLYKPASGDGQANSAPWGTQMNANLDTLDESVLSGPLSARPSAGVANRVYFATNQGTNGKLYVDSGTAWSEWTVPASSGGTGGSSGALPPWWARTSLRVPLVSGFSWRNQGSATASDKTSCLYLAFPAKAGDSVQSLVKAIPSAPYQVDLAFVPGAGASYNGQGLVLVDTASGKLIVMDLFGNSNEVPYFRVVQWNSNTSASSVIAYSRRCCFASPAFLRVTDDGTNRSYLFSLNGQIYENLLTHARTTWITPNQVGFGDTHNDSGNPTTMSVIDWAGA